MNRPARTVGILGRSDVAQPAIRPAIGAAARTTRAVFPQRWQTVRQIMHVFNVDTMEKFTSQAEFHTPHLRLTIPSIPLPEIMEPCFRGRLLPDLCGLMIDAARDRRGMLAEIQGSHLLPAQPRYIRPIDHHIDRTPVLAHG